MTHTVSTKPVLICSSGERNGCLEAGRVPASGESERSGLLLDLATQPTCNVAPLHSARRPHPRRPACLFHATVSERSNTEPGYAAAAAGGRWARIWKGWSGNHHVVIAGTPYGVSVSGLVGASGSVKSWPRDDGGSCEHTATRASRSLDEEERRSGTESTQNRRP
jgi:hypothetical protein